MQSLGTECRRYGKARLLVPPSPFRFTQNTVFGILLNDKATYNDGKRNNYVQT